MTAASMGGVVVRPGTREDADELARLKVAFGGGSGAAPTQYAALLAEWIDRQGDRLLIRVAEQGGRLVGMAWLVVYERVPNEDAPTRLCGDVQSVFVEPGHRGSGIGTRLLAGLCAEADRAGLARITVHSSPQGRSLYLRSGFAADGLLLGRERPSA